MHAVSMVFHLLLHKQKLLQFSTGHFTPAPGDKGVFKSLPPDYPRASGNQPRDITVWTRLYHLSQSTWVLETSLCAGVLCPIIIPLVLFTFQLLHTCLMQTIETNWFYFLAFKKAWFKYFSASHDSSNTSLKARAQRLQKKIYIYIHNEYVFYVFKFRKNASHVHTKIHQENTRGKRQQETHRKAQSFYCNVLLGSVFNRGNISMHWGKPDNWAYFSVPVGVN